MRKKFYNSSVLRLILTLNKMIHFRYTELKLSDQLTPGTQVSDQLIPANKVADQQSTGPNYFRIFAISTEFGVALCVYCVMCIVYCTVLYIAYLNNYNVMHVNRR